MADLDMEIDRLTAPVVGSDGRSSGILARTDGGEPIEQVFALVSHDVGATADSLASPDARRSPVLELTGDDHRSV